MNIEPLRYFDKDMNLVEHPYLEVWSSVDIIDVAISAEKLKEHLRAIEKALSE